MNPERPWPALDALRDATEAAGKTLAPRLTVYPEYVRDPERWLDPDVRFPVLVARPTREGLARDDDWAAGGDDAAARLAACRRRVAVAPPARAARRSARCSTACSRAKRSASTRS